MSKNSNWASPWWPPIGDHMEAKPTITEFLQARIAEDEAVAGTAYPWESFDSRVSEWESSHSGGIDIPATRLRAECAAKRAIIAEHSPIDPCDAHDADCKTIACDTLRALAAIYSDHPDYQSVWSMS